jgi:O-methyltransferase involved in polyketide biosynthesis
VVVGAGYDGRAIRFASPGVRFFEVDHPATQLDKRARLASVGVVLPDVVFLPIDLLQDNLRSALRAGVAAVSP